MSSLVSAASVDPETFFCSAKLRGVSALDPTPRGISSEIREGAESRRFYHEALSNKRVQIKVIGIVIRITRNP